MIYIAAPYSSDDKNIIIHRVKTVCRYSAELLSAKISCVSPITLGTGILTHAELPTDFEFWQHLSYDLLFLCDQMHVITLDGWESSIGVQNEINFAKKHKIPITYVEDKKFLVLI